MSGTPRGVYEERLAARRDEARELGRRERRLSHGRLVAFAAALVWVGLALARTLPWLGLVVPALAFALLVLAHERARLSARRAARAAAFYEDAIARLELRITGHGKSGERFRDALHPYVDHLDVFGVGSLYELLCRAQTEAGEERLAGWLSEPAPVAEIRARHEAVRELAPRVDLREDLSVLGPDVRGSVQRGSLARFGQAPPLLAARDPRRFMAPVLAALALIALASGLATAGGFAPLLWVVALELALSLPLRARVHRVLKSVEQPARELALLAELLARLEREPLEAPRLRALRARLLTDAGVPPSLQIAALRRRIDLLEARRNQLFAPLTPLLLWSTQIAFSIEAWRAQSGPKLSGWLDVVGELEALLDLAAHAYDHPEDVYPEILERGPRLDAVALGHPLLPEQEAVRNDLVLSADRALYVVSGSNMSGKSTWLRTIGVNAVLALAGAPVRARALRISPLAIGATLRNEDSLAQGRSRFYAEITCLRHIVERSRGSLPVLFLLDEILAGTNSHDRRIGAGAVLRSLLEAGAVGLVTTHDLALAEIAREIGARARNVHFQDELAGGEMIFDYRLREGVVTKSNAIDLMRAVGLEVGVALAEADRALAPKR